METFYVEHTDTFAGEANYCWVHRFKVHAKSARHAITKVKREIWGAAPRHRTHDYGDMLRVDIIGSPECMFVQHWDEYCDQYRTREIV